MIFSAPQYAKIQYPPSYVEIGDSNIRQQYQATEGDMIRSREGSEYVRRRLAQIELAQTFERLGSLSPNWDSYGSERPSQGAIRNAAAIANAFIDFGLIPDAVTASAEGGVAICFMRNDRYADLEVFNSGDILAVRYSSHQEPKAWVIPPDAAASDATIQVFSEYLFA